VPDRSPGQIRKRASENDNPACAGELIPVRSPTAQRSRRRKQAAFRDADRTLDNFDFAFNPKMNRSLVFDLATGAFINKREDALFLGPGGTGKSHLAQAIGQAAIQQGYRVLYRETHVLLDDLADAVADGTRKEFMESLTTVPLLIIDDFGVNATTSKDLITDSTNAGEFLWPSIVGPSDN
jgi:DNA replication protein DnaC